MQVSVLLHCGAVLQTVNDSDAADVNQGDVQISDARALHAELVVQPQIFSTSGRHVHGLAVVAYNSSCGYGW